MTIQAEQLVFDACVAANNAVWLSNLFILFSVVNQFSEQRSCFVPKIGLCFLPGTLCCA